MPVRLTGRESPLFTARYSRLPRVRIFSIFLKHLNKNLLKCSYIATFERNSMAITKLSSRDFNQDTSRAKRAAKRGPVFITDRGRPSHVLLTVEEYQKITAGQKSVADLLAMPAAADIEFEPPRVRGNLHEPADLT